MVATGGLGLSSRKLFAQAAPNQSLYDAANAAHSIANAHAFYNVPTSADWLTVMHTMDSCIAEWKGASRDAGVQAAMPRVSASMITPASIDQATTLQQIQMYQPSYTIADLQLTLQHLNDGATVTEVIAGLQANGLSYYMDIAYREASLIAGDIESGVIPARAIHASPNMRPPAQPPGGGGGGGSRYTCQTDGALVLAAGTAFAVLSVMTMGSVDVLAGAAWGGFAIWGGLGTSAWGAGHFIAGCGF